MVYSTRTWSSGTGPDVDSDPGRVEARRPVIFDNPYIAKSQASPSSRGQPRWITAARCGPSRWPAHLNERPQRMHPLRPEPGHYSRKESPDVQYLEYLAYHESFSTCRSVSPAWAAVRALWVQGDRARRKGDQGRSRVRLVHLDSDRPVGPMLLQYHRGAFGTSTKEVEPHQPSHIGGPGSTGHLGGCALLDHTTGLDHRDPVGQHHRIERVVRDQDRRPFEPLQQVAQSGPHVHAGTDVQSGHGFVEQQQTGTCGQCPCQGHALGLTTGQGAGAGKGVLGQ